MATSIIKSDLTASGSLDGFDNAYWYQYGHLVCVMAENKSRSYTQYQKFTGLPVPKKPTLFADYAGTIFLIGYDGNSGTGVLSPQAAGSNKHNSFSIVYACE